MRSRLTVAERFMSKAEIVPSGCVEWAAGLNRGYGVFYDGQRLVKAHRWSYEYFVGPIPDGLHIDHLCRNTRCVNPAHLEPVTPRENVLRGVGLAARQAQLTHCVRGHEFTEGNTYRAHGRRYCRTCRRDAAREAKRAFRKSA